MTANAPDAETRPHSRGSWKRWLLGALAIFIFVVAVADFVIALIPMPAPQRPDERRANNHLPVFGD